MYFFTWENQTGAIKYTCMVEVDSGFWRVLLLLFYYYFGKKNSLLCVIHVLSI